MEREVARVLLRPAEEHVLDEVAETVVRLGLVDAARTRHERERRAVEVSLLDADDHEPVRQGGDDSTEQLSPGLRRARRPGPSRSRVAARSGERRGGEGG